MEPINILMVDDQPGKLLTYESMLAETGERLVKAETAREALGHLLKEDIAVVLMDVNMPELDGFELAAMIREHPRCKRTAIIFVSAVHLSDVDRVRGYETGAVDYVSVPVIPEILRAKIGVFADLYRKTAELERLNRTLEERVSARTAELERTIGQPRGHPYAARRRRRGEPRDRADRRLKASASMAPICRVCSTCSTRPTRAWAKRRVASGSASRSSASWFELHGGQVEARSAGLGHGSEFVVVLPTQSAPTAAAVAPAVARPAGGSRRILVVDDNQDAAESLAVMLQFEGNDVQVEFDGESALAAIGMFHPDVVLMDIGMPRLDGHAAARAIRQGARGQDVVLIALTGWGGDEDRQPSSQAGFDRHLVKPIVADELLALLASLARPVSR